MARTEIPLVVQDPSGSAVPGAAVTVKNRVTNANATIYQTESGSSTYANPTTTDPYGRVTGWLDEGAYRADVSGPGISPYSESFESSSGAGVSILRGTTLPGSPSDGQEYVYSADSANGVGWRMRWTTATNRWEFVGGGWMESTVTAQETVSSTTYTDLATVGPSLTVPVAGVYLLSASCRGYSSATTNNGYMSVSLGGATAADADSLTVSLLGAANAPSHFSYAGRRKTFAAAAALVAKYRYAVTGTATFAERRIAIQPVYFS